MRLLQRRAARAGCGVCLLRPAPGLCVVGAGVSLRVWGHEGVGLGCEGRAEGSARLGQRRRRFFGFCHPMSNGLLVENAPGKTPLILLHHRKSINRAHNIISNAAQLIRFSFSSLMNAPPAAPSGYAPLLTNLSIRIVRST